MSVFSDSKIREHVAVLREKVFLSDQFLPQFNLLIDDVLALAKEVQQDTCVASVERMLLYGKNLFSPLFQHARYISLDSSPKSADSRGAYNAQLVDDPRFLDVSCESIRCEPDALNLPSSVADLVLVPNLVHHVQNQNGLWSEIYRILRPGGRVYVFEPTLREVHQVPDDFLRYTPQGLQSVLEGFNFGSFSVRTTGGPFTAIAYCWTQALQYLDETEKAHWQSWFSDHYQTLIDLEARFPTNQFRKHTSFPTAFSVTAQRN
jgi:SAM-dependent methyltransferase